MPGLGGLRLEPRFSERVWGGQRLKPSDPPIGEAWIVWEENRVATGPFLGRTLAELAREHGPELLGRKVVEQTGPRFPLLIKLLDTAEWLSLQVHPQDEQAVQLEGPGHFGKTEAWHILDAEPGAQLICGLKSGTPRAAVEQAIRDGSVLDWVQYLQVQPGDSVFVHGGTIHALGPGLLLYEVQQTSDITYRVYDWDRPATAGRVLHIDKSLAVTDPDSGGTRLPAPPIERGSARLLACPYFALDLLAGQTEGIGLNTRGESFHAITVIDGSAHVEGQGWRETLGRFETVVVPAEAGQYRVEGAGPFRALKALVE